MARAATKAPAKAKAKGRTHKVAGAKAKGPAFGTPEFRAKYGKVAGKSKARKAAGGKRRAAK